MTRTNLTRCRLTAACLTPGVVLAWASLGATVGVAQPDVRVVGLRWEETVAVQRNGEIEPGEVGRVVVTLENRGDVAATGVLGSIAIVPPIPGVSMISGATTWADLAPGARAEDGSPDQLHLTLGMRRHGCASRIRSIRARVRTLTSS